MSTSRHGTSQRDQVLRLEELRGLLDATKPQRQVRSRPPSSSQQRLCAMHTRHHAGAVFLPGC